MTEHSLDDALESVAVAVGLGLDVPAVKGLTLYAGSLSPNTEYLGVHYETPPCNSLEAVLAHLVNEALQQLISECDDPDDKERIMYHSKNPYASLTEYAAYATDEEILSDYKKCCNADVFTWDTVVVGDVTTDNYQHLPPVSP